MTNIYTALPEPFFVLAPMDDVTDTVFRRVVARAARPDLFFTEFVSVDGLQSPGRERLLKRIRFTEEETPIIAQIWGKTPENYYKTAQQLTDRTLVDEVRRLRSKGRDALPGNSGAQSKTYIDARRASTGAVDAAERGMPGSARKQTSAPLTFAGIDINMGCPDKTIIKNGCCAALINNRQLALEIIQATKEGVSGKLPVSVKTRLGFNEVDLSWHELLLKQDLAALTIHGRTKKQLSNVPADWGKIQEIRELRDKLAPPTKIVGNGDVTARRHGQGLAQKHGLDGIMIGRGIFQDLVAFAENSRWPQYTKAERLALFKAHVELFADTWTANERKVHTLNKFCKVYINGFDGAKELRERLMQAHSTDELVKILAKNS